MSKKISVFYYFKGLICSVICLLIAGMKILFLEQTTALRERLTELILDELGHADFYSAINMDEAVALIRTLNPDAVITDDGFPGLSLSRITQHIKPEASILYLYTAESEEAREAYKPVKNIVYIDKYDDFNRISAELRKTGGL